MFEIDPVDIAIVDDGAVLEDFIVTKGMGGMDVMNLRVKKGLTIQQLADSSGIAADRIEAIEGGAALDEVEVSKLNEALAPVAEETAEDKPETEGVQVSKADGASDAGDAADETVNEEAQRVLAENVTTSKAEAGMSLHKVLFEELLSGAKAAVFGLSAEMEPAELRKRMWAVHDLLYRVDGAKEAADAVAGVDGTPEAAQITVAKSLLARPSAERVPEPEVKEPEVKEPEAKPDETPTENVELSKALEANAKFQADLEAANAKIADLAAKVENFAVSKTLASDTGAVSPQEGAPGAKTETQLPEWSCLAGLPTFKS